MIEVKQADQIIAIIIRSAYTKEGVSFFSPDDFSQQLAYMKHPPGKIIQTHVHNPVPRAVFYTQEVLIMKKGRLRVDLYDGQQVYIASYVLEAGDLILLASGGHGFEVLEAVEMIEVKQGPYMGPDEKTRFSGIGPEEIDIIDE